MNSSMFDINFKVLDALQTGTSYLPFDKQKNVKKRNHGESKVLEMVFALFQS